MNKKPNELITVLIPTFNRAHYLSDAIKSVIAQTYQGWKLIILDDASTDGTPQVASAFLDDPRIQFVRFQSNRGTGAVLSDGLKLVRTPYFIILDSDDWLDIRALQILLDEMNKQNESTGLVFGNTVFWTESEDGIGIKGVQKHKSFKNKYEFMLYRPMIFPRFFRTEAVRAVGGFELDDPHKGRYMEDRYLLLKMINKYRFHYLDCHLYHHRSHEANISGIRNRHFFEETRRYVYTKMLQLWGNEYEPVFEYSYGGWLHLQKLLPMSAHRTPLQSDSSSTLTAVSSTAPKVTVVMPTYNRSAFIQASIESILIQSLKKWHLLIIDDASTDHTEAVVAEYLHDPRVTYVRRPVNGGIGRVLNDALKLIETPYFMQLDADDWVETHTLETLLGSMEKASPDTALAYGNSMLHNRKKDGSYVSTPQMHRTFDSKFDTLVYRWMVIPRFYRTSAVRQVDGWDLNVPFKGRHMEDRQMFYKLAEKHRFLYVDQLFYNYRLHGTNLTLSNVEKYAEIRTYLVQYFFHKWNGPKETGCVMEWHNNPWGWPQFTMVPIKQRKKYTYYLGARSYSELTPKIIEHIRKKEKKNLQKRSIVIFALDHVNITGKYIKGYLLKDHVQTTKHEECFFPLPESDVYLYNDKMHKEAKRLLSAIGCKLVT